MNSIFIEIGDQEYEISCVSYNAPTPATRDDPGDGGEACPGSAVMVHGANGLEVISYASFLRAYAQDQEVSESDADRVVEGMLLETVSDDAQDYAACAADDRYDAMRDA